MAKYTFESFITESAAELAKEVNSQTVKSEKSIKSFITDTASLGVAEIGKKVDNVGQKVDNLAAVKEGAKTTLFKVISALVALATGVFLWFQMHFNERWMDVVYSWDKNGNALDPSHVPHQPLWALVIGVPICIYILLVVCSPWGIRKDDDEDEDDEGEE